MGLAAFLSDDSTGVHPMVSCVIFESILYTDGWMDVKNKIVHSAILAERWWTSTTLIASQNSSETLP